MERNHEDDGPSYALSAGANARCQFSYKGGITQREAERSDLSSAGCPILCFFLAKGGLNAANEGERPACFGNRPESIPKKRPCRQDEPSVVAKSPVNSLRAAAILRTPAS
jgi:hypothetical protein